MSSLLKNEFSRIKKYFLPDGKPRIKISFKSDIWSLGCILYNLTYGKMPFSHIRQPLMKLQAIISPSHAIQFPDRGHDPHLVDTIKW